MERFIDYCVNNPIAIAVIAGLCVACAILWIRGATPGPKGDPGETGAEGLTGKTGDTGATGERGPAGVAPKAKK